MGGFIVLIAGSARGLFGTPWAGWRVNVETAMLMSHFLNLSFGR